MGEVISLFDEAPLRPYEVTMKIRIQCYARSKGEAVAASIDNLMNGDGEMFPGDTEVRELEESQA